MTGTHFHSTALSLEFPYLVPVVTQCGTQSLIWPSIYLRLVKPLCLMVRTPPRRLPCTFMIQRVLQLPLDTCHDMQIYLQYDFAYQVGQYL